MIIESDQQLLSVARLPEIAGLGPKEWELNWVGQVRRHPADSIRQQVFVRFVMLPSFALCNAWISLDRFPYLILGSRWRNGVMVGKPVGVRNFTIGATCASTWREISVIARNGSVSFEPQFSLSFDRHAAPVLELTTRRDEILYLPLSELLRTHYFSVPQALPSLLGGQAVYGSLASSNLQAWHTEGTRWLDERAGIAMFDRAPFINKYQACCLARLLFSPSGRNYLKQLRRWIDTEFQPFSFRSQVEERGHLPRLGLPYEIAQWSAIARRLDSSLDGRPRYLILQLLSFDADEPYQELVDPTENVESERRPVGGANVEVTFSKRLEPLVDEHVDLVDKLSDPQLPPISLADVLPVDLASLHRRTVSASRAGGVARSVREVLRENVAVQGASLQMKAARGQGHAPCRLIIENSDWPKINGVQRRTLDAVRDALRPFLEFHHRVGIGARLRSLPGEEQAYSFEFLQADNSKQASPRQFLVIEVEIGGRYAYVIDAQRHSGYETFPLAVLSRRAGHLFGPFSSEQIELAARIFDRERRAGQSWVAASELREQFTVRPVRHPPQRNTTPRELQAFARRVTGRLMALIGDVRALV